MSLFSEDCSSPASELDQTIVCFGRTIRCGLGQGEGSQASGNT